MMWSEIVHVVAHKPMCIFHNLISIIFVSQNLPNGSVNYCCHEKDFIWNILQCFSDDNQAIKNYAIIILNRPILHDERVIKKLWQDAIVRITVDGGTNRWESFINKVDSTLKDDLMPPELVTGDFDSIDQHHLDLYTSKGCKIILTQDQNETDFTKALRELNVYCEEHTIKLNSIITICETSGRIDHIMANINTLFLCKERKLLEDSCEVYMLSSDSISWLLLPGYHTIVIPKSLGSVKDVWCSLVPIGEKCAKVTTSGLKWNLKNDSMEFGKLVSTSNTIDGTDQVSVDTSQTLLWSIKMKYFLNNS